MKRIQTVNRRSLTKRKFPLQTHVIQPKISRIPFLQNKLGFFILQILSYVFCVIIMLLFFTCGVFSFYFVYEMGLDIFKDTGARLISSFFFLSLCGCILGEYFTVKKLFNLIKQLSHSTKIV